MQQKAIMAMDSILDTCYNSVSRSLFSESNQLAAQEVYFTY